MRSANVHSRLELPIHECSRLRLTGTAKGISCGARARYSSPFRVGHLFRLSVKRARLRDCISDVGVSVPSLGLPFLSRVCSLSLIQQQTGADAAGGGGGGSGSESEVWRSEVRKKKRKVCLCLELVPPPGRTGASALRNQARPRSPRTRRRRRPKTSPKPSGSRRRKGSPKSLC